MSLIKKIFKERQPKDSAPAAANACISSFLKRQPKVSTLFAFVLFVQKKEVFRLLSTKVAALFAFQVQ